jgi:signal transduction histidine kinase
VADVAVAIANHALFTIGADMGIVALLSEDGNTLDAMVQEGVSDATKTAWGSVPMIRSLPLAVSVMDRKTLLFRSRADIIAAYPGFKTAQSLLPGAAVIIPMVLEGRAVGAIGLSYNMSRGFSEWETAFLETAAMQCAQAIERARFHELQIQQLEATAQQRADKLLRRIIDCIPDAVAALDADMNLLDFNNAFERKFQELYGIELYVGMSLPRILAQRPDVFEPMELNSRRALAGDTFSSVREVTRENMTPIFLETSSSSFKDETSDTGISIHVSRDVTDRIGAELALKRSLSQLADAQTVAKVGSWITDIRSGRPVFEWSDEMFRLLEFDPAAGVPPLEEIGARFFRPGDTRYGVFSVQNHLEDFKPFETESKMYLPNGKVKWVHRVGRSQKDDSGQVVTLLGTVTDITEWKEAESALRLAQDRLEEAQQVAHIGSWELDVGTGVVKLSAEYVRASTREPGLGPLDFSELLALYVPEDTARLTNAVQRAVSEGVGYEMDFRRVQKDGTTRTFHAIGKPIHDGEGKVVRVTHTSLDTTEHQELENQLRQVQKMETIGRFAGAIAHDFNNLLAIIMGHAELLADGILDEFNTGQSINSIQNAANRAANLTQQLLAFSHKQVNNPVVLQPNDLLVGTTAMLRPLIGQSIELITRFSPNIGNIFIDSNQLEQVIVNLVVNARDAMPKGGTLTLQKEDVTLKDNLHKDSIPAGRYVVISIIDTGVGMTEEVQERLFEPYFTTKEKGKGTGIGLATVYGIVQQNRGYISVQSEVGVGTKFMVYFPSLDEAPEVDKPDVKRNAIHDGAETILVVDDESMLRELMVGALRKRGYHVLDAANGEDALKVIGIHGGEINLIVTDMIMPNMGGTELVGKLRETYPQMPVLLVSGYAEELFNEDANSADTLPLLRKPFKTRELTDMVSSLLLK